MSKHAEKKDREDRARRRLARAQLELHAAQEKRARAIARAEQEVERAKQRGNKWVIKATERVERRAGVMVRAEAHLLTATAPKHPTRLPVVVPSEETTSGAAPELSRSSPLAAAEALEQRVSEVVEVHNTDRIVVPETAELETHRPANHNEATEENRSQPW